MPEYALCRWDSLRVRWVPVTDEEEWAAVLEALNADYPEEAEESDDSVRE